MCGIAGILSLKSNRIDRLERMLDVQAHRGPDDRGTHLDGPVALGHLRLSILDLSPSGHQPMLEDEGRLALVFNGEIFNYRELRSELAGKGYTFRSQSDTEVILKAYDEWGLDCFQRFNGMWAIALYDVNAGVICSRDRFGVKPLYYSTVDDEFVCASEIKALLAATPSLARANEHYLARFLSTSLLHDGEETFFEGIKQLLPGHTLLVEVDGPRPQTRGPQPYWRFDETVSLSNYDYRNPVQTFRELLQDSVRIRLRSDAAVGTCLSGGLDSSSIVALASRLVDQPVHTFSSLYAQPEYDESYFVELVNQAFGTSPYQVRPEPGRLLDVLPKIVWHQDEPSAGPGLYSQWHVIEAARGRVKVLLDGQGADELLAGYDYFYPEFLRTRLEETLRKPSPRRAARLLRDWRRVSAAKGPMAGGVMSTYLTERAKQALRLILQKRRAPEIRRDFLRLVENETPWRVDGPLDDFLDNSLYDLFFRKGLPALLHYEDRSSMAFSIEARTPFLDYRLVEFAMALPFHEKLDGVWTKSILRRAMQDVLPTEVTWRKDKKGYPTPFGLWLRDEFRNDAEEIIYSTAFRKRGIFDPTTVDVMWRAHVGGLADHSWNVWRWLTVELWFQQFVDCHRC